MHWPVRIFYVVLTVLLAVKTSSSASHDQGLGLAANFGTITACAGVRRAEGFLLVAGKNCPFHWASNARTVVASLGRGRAWTVIADTPIQSVHPVQIP